MVRGDTYMTHEEFEKFLKTFKPKNFKYKFIFTDEELQEEILRLSPVDDSFIEDELDTLKNDALVREAVASEFVSFGNNVKKAKEPTFIENGVYISKIMVSKTGKALLDVQMSYFVYENNNYVGIKFVYEKFYILEIFIII